MRVAALARQILADWRSMSPAARPYVEAMQNIDVLVKDVAAVIDGEKTTLKVRVQYGAEHAMDVVSYFLSNAGTWRGAVAKRVKSELRTMLKEAWEANPV